MDVVIFLIVAVVVVVAIVVVVAVTVAVVVVVVAVVVVVLSLRDNELIQKKFNNRESEIYSISFKTKIE